MIVAFLIFAVTITRAPLLVPLTSFQSAIVVYFLERRTRLLRAIALPVGAVSAIGLLGAGLAWLIGPPLIRLVGSGFDITGGAAAALTVGATSTAILMLTGCATLANEEHRAYSLGWWVGTACAVGLLSLPIGLTERTAAALKVSSPRSMTLLMPSILRWPVASCSAVAPSGTPTRMCARWYCLPPLASWAMAASTSLSLTLMRLCAKLWRSRWVMISSASERRKSSKDRPSAATRRTV